MTQLIDKSALVAEIENWENIYKKCPTHNSYEEGLKEGRLIGYKDALHKINTLEVKEVDSNDAFIEKACQFLKSYRQDTYDGTGYIAGIVNDKTIEDLKTYMKGE